MRGLAFSACIFALSCGGAGSTKTIPTLPGDGDTNTDKPKLVVEDRPTDQPWGDPATLLRLPELGTAAPLALPAVESFTLKNGLEVLLVADRTAPVTSFQLAIKAGRERSKRNLVGVARLTAVLTTRGTKTRTAEAIVKAIEGANGDLTADASHEATLISCSAVSNRADSCTQVLADISANATFPAAAFEELRSRLREAAMQQVTDAPSLAGANFQNLLWGGEHPRGWPISRQSLAAITRNDVLAWYRTYYRPNNAVLAVSGDFDAKAMRGSLERAFGRWARANVPAVAEAKVPAEGGIRVRVVDKPDEKVAQIRLGHFGVAEGDDDFMATNVVNAALAGQPVGSRLEATLAEVGQYDVLSQLDSNRGLGSWVVSIAAPSADAVGVAQRVRDAMASLKSTGPTAEEVHLAAGYIAGSYATRFQTVADVAGAVLAARLYGKDAAEVANYPVRATSVTPTAAAAAAKRHLSPESLAIVFVGQAAEIVPALEKAGWKYEVTSYVDPIAPWDRASAATEGKRILDAAVTAKGGEKALAALKTFQMSGESVMSVNKRTATSENRFMAPDKLRHDMNIPDEKTTVTSAIDGNTGWAAQVAPQGTRVIEFPASEIEAAKTQVWRHPDLVLLRHLEPGAEVALVDELELEGNGAWAVRLISQVRRASVVLYIDKKTSFLVGMSYQEMGPQGVIVAEERYGNYKRVGGLQFAHSRTTLTEQLDIETKVTTIKINEPMDAAIFAKPAE